MEKFVDNNKDKLIYLGVKSDSSYWESHWQEANNSYAYNGFVSNVSKQYLPSKEAKIVDGGCGNGSIVHTLHKDGYNAFGVDYAKKTVAWLNETRPELTISEDDVRSLKFEDNYFDGYWSLGVIEHFLDGYSDIAKDMYRVIKPEGYLFLTVPNFSALRCLKAKLGFYKTVNSINRDEFYQFAMNTKKIIADYEALGFKLVESRGFDAVKGLKDEVAILRPILQYCYDTNNIFTKVIRKIINITLYNFSNHSRLFVFKK